MHVTEELRAPAALLQGEDPTNPLNTKLSGQHVNNYMRFDMCHSIVLYQYKGIYSI
jgi:hypothetical protein